MTEKLANMKSIVLGGGCFWCLEAVYHQIKGLEVVSGYAGGTIKNPSYEEVCSGRTGHAEVIRITYNPNVISLEDILEIFFEIHDPTTRNRQGNDVGTQYRSIILYNDPNEIEIINKKKKKAEEYWKKPIVTEVQSLQEFYQAEEYHQQYYKKNPRQGYCRVMIDPKITKLRKSILPKMELSESLLK
ncbi:MAG: peptide-methionine (S)-S-oxide reductase MsrA [Candidatus Heimdallarchaeota archaeon]|nr:peptide-methionine (S)-S-oxide reductase MsrA [Candidatus Heimdallarchaeota archaeon]